MVEVTLHVVDDAIFVEERRVFGVAGIDAEDGGFVGERCGESEGRRKTVMPIGIVGLCG